MQMNVLLVLITLSYGAIQALELIAVLGRIAGLHGNASVLGYSIQQSIYLGTRFFLVLLLPALGFLADRQMAPADFVLLMHACLAAAGVLGLVVWFFRSAIIDYELLVIEHYLVCRSLPKSFILAMRGRQGQPRQVYQASPWPQWRHWGILISSCVIFWTYSVGMMLTFFVALLFPSHRAAISQLSGAVNAFAAVILAFFVEPRVASAIDFKNPEATELVYAMFWGRLLAVLVLGHLTLFVLPT